MKECVCVCVCVYLHPEDLPTADVKGRDGAVSSTHIDNVAGEAVGVCVCVGVGVCWWVGE